MTKTDRSRRLEKQPGICLAVRSEQSQQSTVNSRLCVSGASWHVILPPLQEINAFDSTIPFWYLTIFNGDLARTYRCSLVRYVLRCQTIQTSVTDSICDRCESNVLARRLHHNLIVQSICNESFNYLDASRSDDL